MRPICGVRLENRDRADWGTKRFCQNPATRPDGKCGVHTQKESAMLNRSAAAPLLTVGTRIYNRGDMANPDHFGTVVEVNATPYGTNYVIQPDAEAERERYTIPAVLVAAVDTGNGLSRIVTEEEHKRYSAERLEALKASMPKVIKS